LAGTAKTALLLWGHILPVLMAGFGYIKLYRFWHKHVFANIDEAARKIT
jgi:hypothetical protein